LPCSYAADCGIAALAVTKAVALSQDMDKREDILAAGDLGGSVIYGTS
jgi:hypothetical protein